MKTQQIKGLSPYGEFFYSSRGIEFTYKGIQVDKWEVWEMGYHSLENIMKGLTQIKARYIR